MALQDDKSRCRAGRRAGTLPVAAIVIGKWEKDFDHERAKALLSGKGGQLPTGGPDPSADHDDGVGHHHGIGQGAEPGTHPLDPQGEGVPTR